MSDGLDVIVLDDDPGICEIVSELIESFFTWGKVYYFSDPDKAISFCLERDIGVAIFVVDVFLGGLSGFYFLDAIEGKFPTAHEDSIISAAMPVMTSLICVWLPVLTTCWKNRSNPTPCSLQ